MNLEQRVQELERENALLRTLAQAPQWVYLDTPLTSGDWSLDAFSDVGTSTQLDLSAVFGVPAGVKAVMVRLLARDSAAHGTSGLYVAFGPSETNWQNHAVLPPGGDVLTENNGIIACDANGDIWYQINASGAGTMDITLWITGYLPRN